MENELSTSEIPLTDQQENEDEGLSSQELFFKQLELQRQRVEQRSIQLQSMIEKQDKIAETLQDDNEKYTEALNMLKSLNNKINGINSVASEESKNTVIEAEACFESIREMRKKIEERDRAEEQETDELGEKESQFKEVSSEKESQNEREKLAASTFRGMLHQLEDDRKLRERRYNVMKNRKMPDDKSEKDNF